ncbi:MAG: amidohydrolase family protein, partial [Vicinamibacteria bacterium]
MKKRLGNFLSLFVGTASLLGAQERIVLRAEKILDGTGNVLEKGTIVISEGTIREMGGPGSAFDYDLSGLTVLPGLIDTHVHVSWHFDDDGRLHREESAETAEASALYAAENAYTTLLSGFTTVQSLGASIDRPLR